MFLFKTKKLTSEDRQKIMAAISEAERHTTGEIRVHFSHDKKETDILESAQAQFEKLKMHETRDRNGILLYVNPGLKKFSVFGDQGIHQRVGQPFWGQLAEQLSKAIQSKDLTHGITVAVTYLGHALSKHFPHVAGQRDELSNEVSESD